MNQLTQTSDEQSTEVAVAPQPLKEKSTLSVLLDTLRRLAKQPLGLLGLILVSSVIFSALFASVIAPYDPVALDIMNRLQGPSSAHWLGTDQLGRDTFSRVLYGGQIALQVALSSIALALGFGLLLGLLAGFGPRWLDNLILTLFDMVRSFPTIIFALAVVTLTGPSISTIVLVVVVTSIPIYGRVVRTQTQALAQQEFILAERAMNASMPRILFKHMLPNVIGQLLILASMDIPIVITIEAGLSFLGLGIQPPTPSWGSIINDGYSFIRNTPWPIIAGGLPLIITTLGFTFLGESLRDIFDPKLRKDV
ncbi:ABC transporter permease [Aliamphritea ceti]|uniref:ABC transporter permease n=1 Tax=Aliamphritea ceti TaxID=1524258 RepID=UPI0021C3194F|nr:ABC transporter permease [Aliamphritea ceti]